MSEDRPRLPNNSQRLAIVGRTGSGKTQAAVWHLSKRDFDKMPWIIFDFKHDDLINSIERAQHVEVGFLPKGPGIYIVHPRPDQEKEVEDYFWKLWERENVGIYCDEGYMVDNSAFETCLTQGRSKRIPMIVLSQRPVWISRFVWSESDFYQVFNLNIQDDKLTVRKYAPIDLTEKRLPDYYSYYYDVGRDRTYLFSPVPDGDSILAEIESKLANMKARKKI